MQDTNLRNQLFTDFLTVLNQKDPNLSRLIAFLIFRRPVDKITSQGCELAALNPFESPTAQDLKALFDHLPPGVNNQQNLAWPIFDSHFKASDYLPIRAFRSDPSTLWTSVDNLRIFLSSGTTSGPEGRSRSMFSSKGLHFYQASSIAAFLGVLERCVLPFSALFLSTVSVSLIPPVEEWPDSSLAQMVAWFSEIWETHYTNAEDSTDVAKKISAASASGSPLFLFGTAFHFVNLLEQGPRFQLPRGSIVIETGGTKGRSRSVTRAELYQLISEGFGVTEAQIVSEYGMCELASQAWDFVPSGLEIPLGERTFKFPWWVQTGVMNKPSVVEATGEGAVTIFDPLRIDIQSLAIQTEDLAKLFENQSFQLLGRVPRAPLKGCSLRVSDVATNESRAMKTTSRGEGDKLDGSTTILSAGAPKARRWLLELLADHEALNRLATELGNRRLAQEAIVDLTSGLPFDKDGFAKAAKNSLKENAVTSKNWLFIPPSSHSIAPIYPLALAFTAGMSIRIRLPEIAGVAANDTFLARAIDLAKGYDFDLKTLPPTWKLGPHDLLDGESILVFGDDQTCSMMKKFAPGRVSAFGNAISLSMVRGDDFQDRTNVRRLVRDQLSLGQRGCLSSRMITSIGGNETIVLSCLAEQISTMIERPGQTIGDRTARAMEEVRLSQLGFRVFSDMLGVTLALRTCSLDELPKVAASAISQLDFVLPFILVSENTDEISVLKSLIKNLPVKAISLGDESHNALSKSQSYLKLAEELRIVRLGSLGAPSLDGIHLGRPIFAT